MGIYIYLLFVMIIVIIIYYIRSFVFRVKKIPQELFIKGLRDENSGNLEAALISYESALIEIKKRKYNKSHFEEKLIEKLKVLRTMINYENSFQAGKN